MKFEDDVKNVDADATGTDQDKTDTSGAKTFTQEEVNEIVQKRLNREREKYSKLQDEFEDYRKDTDSALDKYEENIKKQIENLSLDIPENVKVILGKLPALEQLDWLSNPDNIIEKRKSPKTPLPETPKQGEGKKTKTRRVF